MDLVDPRYCEIVFKLGEDAYRFLKVQVDGTFSKNSGLWANTKENISYHELEVYVKKED